MTTTAMVYQIAVRQAAATLPRQWRQSNLWADEQPRNHGKLILDATVAEHYPTDLGLLNEARELSERIIDELHVKSNRSQKKKPRTYREIARKAYLSLVKLRGHPTENAVPVSGSNCSSCSEI
jgi:hypothetical protein